MSSTDKTLLVALLASATFASAPRVVAAELGGQEGYALVANLMAESKKDRKAAAEALIAARDVSLVPAIVDAFFFTPRFHRSEMLRVLEALTGEKHSGYYDWVEYIGRSGIRAKERYIEWKLLMLGRKDPAYAKIFYPGAPTKIRLEEVISGGVSLEGIPSLDDPTTIPGSQARYLRKEELVFGVELGGESRAYPRRFLSWHEMLNDVVGGHPVTLSYCTLCGSAILYSGLTPSGKANTFGTSGLLYRSNKLMVDRQSFTLWSNLTGEAVVGRLAGGKRRLEVLPMTLTTWAEWLGEHPETRVLDLAAIESTMAARGIRFPYLPGAAERARKDVAFPVWPKSDRLERDTEIFALEINGAAKAYTLDRLAKHGVVHDRLGGEDLVLLSNPESGAVRAYASGGRSFQRTQDPFELADETGALWRVTEDSLVAAGGGARLPRIARGHIAYWFGWYGFHPQTEVWDG